MKPEIVTVGSLYFNGHPSDVGELLVGSNIKVQFSQNGFAEGLLVEYNEYDLVVEVKNAEIPDISNCVAWQKGQLVIDRKSIISVLGKQ